MICSAWGSTCQWDGRLCHKVLLTGLRYKVKKNPSMSRVSVAFAVFCRCRPVASVLFGSFGCKNAYARSRFTAT